MIAIFGTEFEINISPKLISWILNFWFSFRSGIPNFFWQNYSFFNKEIEYTVLSSYYFRTFLFNKLEYFYFLGNTLFSDYIWLRTIALSFLKNFLKILSFCKTMGFKIITILKFELGYSYFEFVEVGNRDRDQLIGLDPIPIYSGSWLMISID